MVDGNSAKKQWISASELKISNWPWHDHSKYPTPEASVKCIYSDKGIYMLFKVKERFIQAKFAEYQEAVWQDSCVEFFAAPDSSGYFNFEISCIGTLLLHWNQHGKEHTPVPPAYIKNIKIISSLGNKAIEYATICPVDGYSVECFFPFSVFTKYLLMELPKSGTSWRANFFKCGDKTPEPSWGSWFPVNKPEPSFHHPEYFGEIRFE